MVKNSRKKQKLASESRPDQPLGSQNILDEDAEKDDEERRLESILFGKTFTARAKSSKEHVVIVSDDEEDLHGGGGNVLEHLQDEDVCNFTLDKLS